MKKTPVKESSKPTLAFLIESELEKAEVILAAKGISEKLQKMAEDLSKIEADDIMPILDSMRLAFGPQLTDSFNDITTAKVRQTMEAVKEAKDAISKELARLEGSVNGEMTNDMGMGDTGGDDLGADTGDMSADVEGGAADFDSELGGDAGAAPEAGDEGVVGDVEAPEGDGGAEALDAAFGDQGANAAGRAKKESIERNVKALRESRNPDRLVFETFRRTLKETKGKAVVAAKAVAEAFAIDYADVVEIIKEGKTFKDMKGRKDKNDDRRQDRKDKRRDRPSDLDETKLDEFEAKMDPSKKGMFKGKTKEDLRKEKSELKKSGPHKAGSAAAKKEHEVDFALRAKNNWGKAE